MGIELSLLDIIEGRKKAPVRLSLLRAAGALFETGVKLRHFAYDQKLLSIYRSSLPVISVGNILAGGAGKTPFVCLLARLLCRRAKVAILLRGYRSAAEKRALPRVVHPSDCADLCGDEALLLKHKFPEVEVIVGKDRVAGARMAEERGAEVILLDDGMQHRRLHRDCDIALLPADDPFGEKTSFLPGGFLRDTRGRLAKVDLIGLTNVRDAEQFVELKQCVAEYTRAPVFGLQQKVVGGEKIVGKKVALFCAIGRPHRFIRTVQELGAEIVHMQIAPDHRKLPPGFEKEALQKGADLLVCTEKDAVKMTQEQASLFCVIGVEVFPAFEEALLDQTLKEYP
jgi:tetraacyldisaccharide 4'-kinase